MENGPQILETPIWLLGARIAQAVLALIIMAMAGVLMHGAYLDVHGLCVATVSRNRDEAVYQHIGSMLTTSISGPVHLDCRRLQHPE